MLAPWPVFQSLVAGQRTLASASMRTYWTRGSASSSARRGVVGLEGEQEDGALLAFAEGLHFIAAALDALLLEERGLVFFEWIECVEEARCGKAERGSSFPGCPYVDEAMERIFALLDALFVADGAWPGARGAAEAFALIADDGLDGREQLGSGHETDTHAGAFEDGFDDFAVVVVGDDDAVLDGVSADDAVGWNLEVEDGVAGGGELMNQLFGGGSAIEGAGVAFFEDDDATALDAGIFRHDGGGDEVGEGDVGNEASALVDLQQGFFAGVPIGNADASAQHAGVNADVGNGLSETEGTAPGFSVFAWLRRGGEGLVAGDLLPGAALVNGGEGEEAGEACGGGSAIDPGELKGGE